MSTDLDVTFAAFFGFGACRCVASQSIACLRSKSRAGGVVAILGKLTDPRRSRTPDTRSTLLAIALLIYLEGCAIPIAFFPAPAKGSDKKLTFVDAQGNPVLSDGLLLVRRFRHWEPWGGSEYIVEVFPIRHGEAHLPSNWVLAYFQIGIGHHPMAWIVPAAHVCPVEAGGILPFVPGYHGAASFDQLGQGRIILESNASNMFLAGAYWENPVHNMRPDPSYKLVANSAELEELQRFLQAHWKGGAEGKSPGGATCDRGRPSTQAAHFRETTTVPAS
jgi:hypothetical protein